MYVFETCIGLRFSLTFIISLSMDATSRNAVIALADRRSQMLTISSDDHKGTVEYTYVFNEPEAHQATYDFGAVLANKSQSVIYGNVRGCVAVWDRSTADVSFGMSHAEDDRVMAVSVSMGLQLYMNSLLISLFTSSASKVLMLRIAKL